jgi:hypothetical protein
VTFSSDAVHKIYDGIRQNAPLVLTHSNSTPIGFATKFAISPNDEISYEGYVFEEKDKLLKEGFDSVSGEFDINADDGNVLDGQLERIAFVKVPAVSGTELKKKKEVKMEGEQNIVDLLPGVIDEVVMMSEPTMDAFLAEVRKKLEAKGLNPIQVNSAISVIRSLVKIPYPQAKTEEKEAKESAEFSQTMAEFLKEMESQLKDKKLDDATVKKVLAIISSTLKSPYPKAQAGELEKLGAQVEDLEEQLSKYRETELGTLKNEVAEFGLDAEKLVSGLDTMDAISMLGRLKESVAMSGGRGKEKGETTVHIGAENLTKEILDELGFTETDI